MLPTDDQPSSDQVTDQRVTVAEAAALLGLSEDAVRSRLKRGTLRKEKGSEGAVFVVLGADGVGGRPPTSQPTDQTLVEVLRDQVTYLREQLDQEREGNRENRRIIAGLVRRVPELEAAPRPREGPEEPSKGSGHDDEAQPEPEKRRSWLYRFFWGP